MSHHEAPAASRGGVLGGRWMDSATKDRLFGLMADFDRRDRTVVQQRDEWARYGNVLAANAQELDDYLAAEDVGLTSSIGAPIESAVAEVERLVFNACTAALARVDHHRRAVRKQPGEFQQAYDGLAARLRDSDEHVLVNGVRQYVTHVGLTPLTFMGFASVTGHEGLAFYIRADALRACDEFKKARSKAVLDRQPASVDVRALVSAYAAMAVEQDEAVLALFERTHSEALDAEAAAWKRVADAWEEAGFGAWVGRP